jgi:hypothetical protein
MKSRNLIILRAAALIFGAILILFAYLIAFHSQSLLDLNFYLTKGLNGGNLDQFYEDQKILGRNYPRAFQEIRSENIFLVRPDNFLKEKGKSDNCLDMVPYSTANDRLIIQSKKDTNSIGLSVAGYLDSCIKEQKKVDYAIFFVSSSVRQNYRFNIEDFDDLKVKEWLDCIAYEHNGQKFINFAIRIENGTPNNYDNKFESNCEVNNLPSGTYTIQYLYGNIGQEAITV